MFLHSTIPNPCLLNQILLKFLSSAMRNSHLGFYPFIPKSQSVFLASGEPCRQELLCTSDWRMHQCNKTWFNLNSVTHEHAASLAREQPVFPHPAQWRLFVLKWPFKSIICSHISTLSSQPQLIPQRTRNYQFLGSSELFLCPGDYATNQIQHLTSLNTYALFKAGNVSKPVRTPRGVL